MYTTDLIDAISDRTGLPVPDARKALNAALDVITEAMARGEKVALTGFGAFENVLQKPRMARNPATGEPIPVPAKRKAVFTAGTDLKRAAQDVAVTA